MWCIECSLSKLQKKVHNLKRKLKKSQPEGIMKKYKFDDFHFFFSLNEFHWKNKKKSNYQGTFLLFFTLSEKCIT